MQSHPNIKYVTSISDLISKVIDIELGDYTRVQVKPEGWGQIAGATPAPVVPMAVELDPDDEPVASEEELSRLAAQKEQELEEETGIANNGDYYTAAFVNEAVHDAALHGERLYDGSTCPNCGSSRMVQNGTCKVCMDCGTTTGCS